MIFFRVEHNIEEPAILICGLLLSMRRMYVASIRLDFH